MQFDSTKLTGFAAKTCPVTLSQEMPDLKERVKEVLGPSLALAFSSNNSAVLALYSSSTKDMKTYIIGCLLLSLTASVRPQFTLLEDRLKTLKTLTLAMNVDEATESSLAEAGFFFQVEEDSCSSGKSSTADSAYGSSRGFGSLSHTHPALVCFHCCVRVSFSQVRAHPNPLTAHRVVSPNCYYARLLDLAQSHGGLADTLAVSADARRYEKALRKLSIDLKTDGIRLAAEYGYDEKSIIVWATRQFMRANGACPSRAGDLVALAQESEGLFADKLLKYLDVRQVLDLLDLQQRVSR